MTQEPFTNAHPTGEVYEGPLGTRTIEENPVVHVTPTPLPPADPNAAAGADTSSKDVAKDEAAQLGQSTAQAGQKVAGTARDQAAGVAGEASSQAKDLLGQARTELTDQTHTQQQRVAEGLRSISQELRSMSESSQQQGVAGDLARQASEVIGDAAGWLQERDPGAVLDEVRSFARRRPGAFLGLALTAGVVAGRLTRGVKDSGGPTDGQTGSPTHRAAETPPATVASVQTASGPYEPVIPTGEAYRTGTATP